MTSNICLQINIPAIIHDLRKKLALYIKTTFIFGYNRSSVASCNKRSHHWYEYYI